MRVKRLIVPPEWIDEDSAVLRDEVLHHVQNVMRLTAGSAVVLADGQGRLFEGRIVELGPTTARVALTARASQAPDPIPRLTLVCGIARGARTELVLQKATELGVTRLLPAICARTVARPRQVARKQERWTEIVRQAARQCERAWLPEIQTPMPLAQALDEAGDAEVRLIATLDADRDLACFAQTLAAPPGGVALAVGPEGGFEPREIDLAMKAGFEPVSLGQLVLRAETAAIALLAIVAHLTGRI